MKILIADQFAELAGAQQCLIDLLPAMIERGWKPALAISGEGPLRKRAEALGVICEEIVCGPFGCGRKSLPDVARFVRQLPHQRARFRDLIRLYRPDLVYCNSPRLLPAACLGSRGGPPVLFHVHHYLRGSSRALVRACLRYARPSIVSNCSFVLDPLRGGLAGLPVEVMYNGVQGEHGITARRGLRRIGVVGRICRDKGQHLLIEAAGRLPRFEFVIAGAPQFADVRASKYALELRQAATHLPFEFLGWQDDVYKLLAGLDLLVVPSLPFAEAVPRVVMEAFSAGVPVLAADLPGIREVITDGENGFLFPAGKSAALASEIESIASRPSKEVNAVVRNARLAFERNYSLPVYQRRMLANLARCASRASEAAKN